MPFGEAGGSIGEACNPGDEVAPRSRTVRQSTRTGRRSLWSALRSIKAVARSERTAPNRCGLCRRRCVNREACGLSRGRRRPPRGFLTKKHWNPQKWLRELFRWSGTPAAVTVMRGGAGGQRSPLSGRSSRHRLNRPLRLWHGYLLTNVCRLHRHRAHADPIGHLLPAAEHARLRWSIGGWQRSKALWTWAAQSRQAAPFSRPNRLNRRSRSYDANSL